MPVALLPGAASEAPRESALQKSSRGRVGLPGDANAEPPQVSLTPLTPPFASCPARARTPALALQSSTDLSAARQHHGINAGGALVGTNLSPPGSRGSGRPPDSRGSASRSPLHAPKRSPSPLRSVASKVSDAKVAFVELDPAIISQVCWHRAGGVLALAGLSPSYCGTRTGRR